MDILHKRNSTLTFPDPDLFGYQSTWGIFYIIYIVMIVAIIRDIYACVLRPSLSIIHIKIV